MASLDYNAGDYEPSKPLGPVPNGTYLVQITESEMKNANSGNGKYLSLTTQIIEGEFKDRKVFINLNIHNQSEQAQRIAREQMSAICAAVNVMNPQDSVQLHNLPFMIDVKCKKGKDNNGNDTMNNNVTGFYPKRHTQHVSSAPTQPASNEPAPWNAQTA